MIWGVVLVAGIERREVFWWRNLNTRNDFKNVAID
jgi:hypothetical protein